MNYKHLISRVLLLITEPKKAWKEIKTEGKQDVMSLFVYPLLALVALLVFLASLLGSDEKIVQSVFQNALTETCTIVVALFGGVYLASICSEKILEQINIKLHRIDSLKLVGYGSILVFLQAILVSVLPDFKLIAYFMQFYGIYILWESMPIFFKELEEQYLRITMVIFVSILASPFIIGLVFDKLIHILN